MKKKILGVLAVGVVLLTGCSTKEGTLTCKIEKDIDSTTKLESTYNVDYKDGYATLLNTTETIISDNKEVLEAYKSNLEKMYSSYRSIKYYDNDIKVEDNKLISTTKVNYEKIDTDKLIEIDKNNKAAMENGKVKVSVLKEAYEQLGATCNDKK